MKLRSGDFIVHLELSQKNGGYSLWLDMLTPDNKNYEETIWSRTRPSVPFKAEPEYIKSIKTDEQGTRIRLYNGCCIEIPAK